MNRSWWRRNAVALIALAVLVPAVTVTVAWNVWRDWLAGSPSSALDATADESVEYAGALISADAAFDEVDGTPRRTRVVAVTVDIDPRGEKILCTVELVETTGAERRFGDANFDVDRPYDPERIVGCDSTQTEPYSMSVDFLVPSDAVGPFTIELWTPDELPRFLRIAVTPEG